MASISICFEISLDVVVAPPTTDVGSIGAGMSLVNDGFDDDDDDVAPNNRELFPKSNQRKRTVLRGNDERWTIMNEEVGTGNDNI